MTTANHDNIAQHKNTYIFAVHTEDLTFRGFYEDYATADLSDALTEARDRWDHFTREEKKARTVTIYQLSREDYDRIQEGEGTYDDYADEVKVYALGYIEVTSE